MLSISTLPSSKLQCLHPYSCPARIGCVKQCRLAEVVEKLLLRARMVCCWMMANPPLIDDLAHKSISLIVHRRHRTVTRFRVSSDRRYGLRNKIPVKTQPTGISPDRSIQIQVGPLSPNDGD